MDFNEIFPNSLISIFLGVIGGIVVYWSYNGVNFFDKGLKFDNKKRLERYLWKYSFILACLFFIATVTSIAIPLLLFKIILPAQHISIIAIFSGVFIIVTLLLKLR